MEIWAFSAGNIDAAALLMRGTDAFTGGYRISLTCLLVDGASGLLLVGRRFQNSPLSQAAPIPMLNPISTAQIAPSLFERRTYTTGSDSSSESSSKLGSAGGPGIAGLLVGPGAGGLSRRTSGIGTIERLSPKP